MTLFARFFRPARPAAPAAAGEIAAGPATREKASATAARTMEREAHARMAQLIDAGTDALDSISDPAELGKLVTDGVSSRLRQLAAEKIDDPDQLRELARQVRQRDKSVYKILRRKLDTRMADERESALRAAEIVAVHTLLQRHALRPYDPHYGATLEQLETRWKSLTPQPAADVAQRAEALLQQCKEVLDQAHRGQLRLDAERVAAQALRREKEEALERARRETLAREADQQAAESSARAEAALVREAESKLLGEQRAAEEDLHRQIGILIRKARGALSDGDTKRAAGVRRAIDEKLPESELPGHLARQLQQLDEKLNDLKQWKDFAVAPKRTELIEEMESLIGSTEDPRLLADRIRGLQQDWRTVGKGIVGDAPADADRFHQAAQAAFQPCQDFFAAQARLKLENLEKRRSLLERLTSFEATLTPEAFDWRLVTRVLREAPMEWRECFPVDRAATRSLQEAFDACLKRLKLALDAGYARNVDDKQALIGQARQLLTREDVREAIESVKQLQAQWKVTGPAPRDRDRMLWGEFREICDAVYQRRQQAFADYLTGLESSKAAALALCEQAEQLATLTGAALLESSTTISQLRATFDALDEMPRADARGLHDRFDQALERCKASVLRQRGHDSEQAYADLFEAGRRVHAYQWAVASGVPETDQQVLKDAAQALIETGVRWPKGARQLLDEALAQAGSSNNGEMAARVLALRKLCIRCEIETGMTTPAEDEGLRREHQVQRLMQGMGQGVRPDASRVEDLVFEWFRIVSVEPQLQEALQARFMRCRKRMSQTRAVG